MGRECLLLGYRVLRTFVDACAAFDTGIFIEDRDVLYPYGVLRADIDACAACGTFLFIDFDHISTRYSIPNMFICILCTKEQNSL